MKTWDCEYCGQRFPKAVLCHDCPDKGKEPLLKRIAVALEGRTHERIAALCDAIQWIVNRGPEKVPSELMEKLKEWGN